MQVQTIESQPFAENSYVLHLPNRKDAVVIDPGLEPDLILGYLRSRGLTLAAILCTHGHADHIGGNGAVKQAWPAAPIMIGHGDAIMLQDPSANLSGAFGIPITSPPADRLLKDGDLVEVAGLHFEVLEIPGHSPGHVVYLDRDRCLLFGGDVLFAGSIGRTDFPGGSLERLAQGIHDKVFVLPPGTVVYPGHGPTTTVGAEMRSNPFVGLTTS